MNVFQKIINKLKVASLPVINYGTSLFYTLGGIAVGNDRYSSCVFACVDAIISRCVMAKLKLVRYNKNGEAERTFDHRLLMR